MTTKDDRAETERTRLLLVHDVESPTKNLAVPPEGEEASPSKGAQRFDLSGLEADRFPSRVPQVSTTDGHRVAAYATSTGPATRIRTAPRTATIVVDTPTEPEPRPDTTPPDPPSGDPPPHVSSRHVPTTPTRVIRDRGDNDTVPDGRTVDRRTRAARIAWWSIGGVAALLMLSIITVLGRHPETPSGTAATRIASPATTSVAALAPTASAVDMRPRQAEENPPAPLSTPAPIGTCTPTSDVEVKAQSRSRSLDANHPRSPLIKREIE